MRYLIVVAEDLLRLPATVVRGMFSDMVSRGQEILLAKKVRIVRYIDTLAFPEDGEY
jgi:hypothetical protein